MTPVRPVPAALVAALLVLTGAACGGNDSGSGSSSSSSGGQSGAAGTESWANGFCGAVSTWQQSVRKVKTQLSSPSTLNAQELQDDVQKVSSSTQALITQLQDVPELNTAAVTDSVHNSLNTLQGQIETQANKLTSLPAANPTSAPQLAQDASSIVGILTAISADTQAALAEIEKTVDQADPKQPFKEAPACQGLTS